MVRLCPGHEFIGPARLADHRLVFTLPDDEWRGGVADLVRAPGDEVWGALYCLSEEDLGPLDAYEGYDPARPDAANDYVRRRVRVTSGKDHRDLEAWCYFVRAPRGHVAPSELYRAALIEGAIERGLPESYIENMRRVFAGNGR